MNDLGQSSKNDWTESDGAFGAKKEREKSCTHFTFTNKIYQLLHQTSKVSGKFNGLAISIQNLRSKFDLSVKTRIII